jgi:hypothetical protein
MALVVEDGTGLSNADSYLSEADADTYHTDHGNPTKWSNATTAQKEEALRLATQYLDATYNGRWRGRRNLIDQALDWPRLDVYDRDGFLLPSDELPAALEHATAEMALRYRELGSSLIPDLSEPGDIRRERVRVGTIEEDIEYIGGKSQMVTYRIVDGLLRDLITAGTRIVRG